MRARVDEWMLVVIHFMHTVHSRDDEDEDDDDAMANTRRETRFLIQPWNVCVLSP